MHKALNPGIIRPGAVVCSIQVLNQPVRGIQCQEFIDLIIVIISTRVYIELFSGPKGSCTKPTSRQIGDPIHCIFSGLFSQIFKIISLYMYYI